MNSMDPYIPADETATAKSSDPDNEINGHAEQSSQLDDRIDAQRESGNSLNDGTDRLFAKRGVSPDQVLETLTKSASYDCIGPEETDRDGTDTGQDESSCSWSTAGSLVNGPSTAPTCVCSRMKRISVTEARNRSFLVGSATSYGSLLGTGQLDDHFHNRKVTILVGTWNMNEIAHCGPHLEDFFLPLTEDTIPDVYVIGTQENSLPRLMWEVIMQEVIGLSHVLLHSTVLGTLHLAIFVRRELLWFFSAPEESTVATRQGTAIKTKGGVGVAFKLFGTSFLFINSHLTAHDHNVKERISDYEKICDGLELPKRPPPKNGSTVTKIDITTKFDCVFWLGDLNFRLSKSRHDVLGCLCKSVPDIENLLTTDQLKNAVSQGQVFHGFKEGLINFAPSYKFDIGTDCYDSSEKQRTPAYTDRVLYHHKKKTTVSCLQYSSVPSVKVSDHKPVYAIFQVSLRPGRDDIPLAAGLFNRNVYLKAIETRAAALNPLLHKGSKLCSIM